jgi:phosphate transport system substrate-binding protein
MPGLIKILFVISVTWTMYSCNRSGVPDRDSATAGIITIVADSSLKHLLDQQVFVFGTMYKYAAIVTEYLPGEKAYERLRNDSIRMVIGYREATQADSAWFLNIKIRPRTHMIGAEAMVLICNRYSSDTALTINELKQRFFIDPGVKHLKSRKLLFDHPSSTVARMFLNKLGVTDSTPPNSFALSNAKEVAAYVSSDTLALGVIPYSSILSDTSLPGTDVRVLAIADSVKSEAVVPTLKTIGNRTYPLILGIYCLSREARVGLATGYTSFILSDAGQRIVLKSGVSPAVMPPQPMNSYGSY